MKNLGIVRVILTALLTVTLAVSTMGEASAMSPNKKIKEAVKLLKNTEFQWVVDAIHGKNLTGRPIKIRFQNLAMISPEYAPHHALACGDSYGNMYVLINTSHKNEPVEAIAAILTHEILHQDDISSIEEETQGWTNEAKCWISLKERFPQIANYASTEGSLVNRLNKMVSMYREANNTNRLIKLAVMEAEGYTELAMNSPGF